MQFINLTLAGTDAELQVRSTLYSVREMISSKNNIEILLRTQFATLNKTRGYNSKYPPYAYTKNGLATQNHKHKTQQHDIFT